MSIESKHIYQVTYKLCGKVYERLVLAKDEIYAWIEVFRSHYMYSELIEVKLWEPYEKAA